MWLSAHIVCVYMFGEHESPTRAWIRPAPTPHRRHVTASFSAVRKGCVPCMSRVSCILYTCHVCYVFHVCLACRVCATSYFRYVFFACQACVYIALPLPSAPLALPRAGLHLQYPVVCVHVYWVKQIWPRSGSGRYCHNNPSN